ncbi:MAG: hypothetical protein ACTSU2_00575 [Promethearchaeota archaeon]
MSNEEEISLEITCPKCGKTAVKKVPKYIFEGKSFGVLKIQINKGVVCDEHQFLVFVDKNGKIRGYESIEYQLITPKQNKKLEEIDKSKISFKDLIHFFNELIRLHIIHAFILNIPIVIVVNKLNEKEKTVILTILKDLFADSFKDNTIEPLKFVNISDYKTMNIAENALIFDDNNYILGTPWKLKKYDFERECINAAIKTKEYKVQLVIFQQEIRNIIKRAEFVYNYITKKGSIYEDELKKLISKEYKIKKVSNYDIALLKEILQFRFGLDPGKIQIRELDNINKLLW